MMLLSLHHDLDNLGLDTSTNFGSKPYKDWAFLKVQKTVWDVMPPPPHRKCSSVRVKQMTV